MNRKAICKTNKLKTLTYNNTYVIDEFGTMEYGVWNRIHESIATCIKIKNDNNEQRIYSLNHFELKFNDK
jgi:hypothetical protein